MKMKAHNQPHRVQEELERAGIQHGQSFRGDLLNLEIKEGSEVPVVGGGVIARLEPFFCNMLPVRVRRFLSRGDGTPVNTQEVHVHNLPPLGPGRYNVENAIWRNNGRIQIIYDDHKSRIKVLSMRRKTPVHI